MPLAWDVKLGPRDRSTAMCRPSCAFLADFQRVAGVHRHVERGRRQRGELLPKSFSPGIGKGNLVLGAPLGAKRALTKAGALGWISEHTESGFARRTRLGEFFLAITVGALQGEHAAGMLLDHAAAIRSCSRGSE